MNLKGIIFDLGWTLIDFDKDAPMAVDDCVKDLDSFFRGNGFELDSRAIFDDYFQEVRLLWQAGEAFLYEYPASLAMLRALRRRVTRLDAVHLTDGVMRHGFTSIIASWQLFPDALDTLAVLRDAGYRLGCVSNINDGHVMRSVVAREKLHDWLWPIYLSEDVGLRKPHPRLFQMVLDDWKLPPDQVVMVGDNRKTDIQGAHNAGLRGIWLDRDVEHPWRRIEGEVGDAIPDATIRQLSELPVLLAGDWGRKREDTMDTHQHLLEMVQRFNPQDQEHMEQDAYLATKLFRLTRELHKLPLEYEDLLTCAALLHDIGYFYGYSGHHKSAYRLIMENDIPNLNEREKQIVALVARYHRGARPKPKHKGFRDLGNKDREIVTKMGAILRLADGLDRSHTNAVEDLECEITGSRVILTLHPRKGNEIERWAGQKKSRFFQDVFGVTVEIR